jgi:hypothetical protein
MIRGTLIAESVRVGSALTGVRLVVREVRRFAADGVPDYQPGIWTVLEFEADESDAEALATDFAAVLDEPGWYVDYSSASETFVIYRDRVFRYPRGDETGRAEAQAYGRARGVPEDQLDWSE